MPWARVLAVAFGQVAWTAQRLKVRRVVAAALADRHDVVPSARRGRRTGRRAGRSRTPAVVLAGGGRVGATASSLRTASRTGSGCRSRRTGVASDPAEQFGGRWLIRVTVKRHRERDHGVDVDLLPRLLDPSSPFASVRGSSVSRRGSLQ